MEVVLNGTKRLPHGRLTLNNITAARHTVTASSWHVPFTDASSTAVQFDVLIHMVIQELTVGVADIRTNLLVVAQGVCVRLVDHRILERPSASVPTVGHFVEVVVTVFGGGHSERLLESQFVIELLPGD